jgi:signal transduction histidine kinase
MSTPSDASSRARLIRAIAHDIRTPLGILTAAHGQIASKVGEDELALRMLEMSRRAVSQLTHLADRLTLSARLEQGVAPVADGTRVDLADAASEAVKIVQRSRRRSGVTVEQELSPALVVRGDPGLVTSAIAELVDNGLRFAESKVRVRTEARGDRVAVVVVDDGRGLEDDAMKRFGVEAPGTGGGLGIGTWLATTIVTAMGGTLKVEQASRPCTVVIELPRDGA